MIGLVGFRSQRGAQQPPQRGIVGRIRRDAQRFVDRAPHPIDVALDATEDDGRAHDPDAINHGVARADGRRRRAKKLPGFIHVAALGADLGQRFEIPGCGATSVPLGEFGLAQRHGFVPTTEIDIAVDEVGDEERPEAAERADFRLPVELVEDHRVGFHMPATQTERVTQLAGCDARPRVGGGHEECVGFAKVRDSELKQAVCGPAGAHAQQRAGFDADVAGASRRVHRRLGRTDDLGIAAHPPQQHTPRGQEPRGPDPGKVGANPPDRMVDDRKGAGLVAELREVPGEPVRSPRPGFAGRCGVAIPSALNRQASKLHGAAHVAGARRSGGGAFVDGCQVDPRRLCGLGHAVPQPDRALVVLERLVVGVDLCRCPGRAQRRLQRASIVVRAGPVVGEFGCRSSISLVDVRLRAERLGDESVERAALCRKEVVIGHLANQRVAERVARPAVPFRGYKDVTVDRGTDGGDQLDFG